MLTRQEYDVLRRRLDEPRKFIQVVLGPRQIGKTTVVRQVLCDINKPHLYFSADDTAVAGSAWLQAVGRLLGWKPKHIPMPDVYW